MQPRLRHVFLSTGFPENGDAQCSRKLIENFLGYRKREEAACLILGIGTQASRY